MAGICVSNGDPGLPVLLIPGNGGNQLEARLGENWAGREGMECPNTGTWFRIWLDVWQLLSKDKLGCFTEIMTLEYDPVQVRSFNKEGVEIRVPGFGHTFSVEFIDPSWSAYVMANVGSYFAPLVDELVSWGYTCGLNVRAAPYDFRFAPSSAADYQTNLKALIETMYRENNNRKVVLVAHSAGGLFAHYFLTHQDQDWKDTYIQTLVSMATPWKGAPLLLRAIVSGFNFYIPVLESLTVREEQRSSEVNILMIPKTPIWDETFVFVSSPYKNYSLENIEELYDDLAFPVGKDLMRLTTGKDYTFSHPGVDVNCWYGNGLETPDSYVYKDGFPDAPPSTVYYSDGDGTVPSKSAKACELWKNDLMEHQYSVHTKAFSDLDHLQLIKHKSFFDAIKDIVY